MGVAVDLGRRPHRAGGPQRSCPWSAGHRQPKSTGWWPWLGRAGSGPDDYKGGTFTISNLGLFGVEAFTPIVNLPEAAILGIGAIVSTPVYRDGTLQERGLCTLSLTADHRIVDGGPAARFLARVRQLVETPALLLERGL